MTTDEKQQYVRLLDSPSNGIGVITKTQQDGRGRTQYLFQQDERFALRIRDYWAEKGDFEPCERPTDEEIAAINAVVKRSLPNSS
jgi:hypothetical protein